MSKGKRGRPSSKRNENEVEGIIKRYIKEHPDIEVIAPFAVFKFVEIIKSELEHSYSQSFWRSKGQMGRERIEEWNKILSDNRKINRKEHQGFYNTESLIESGKGILTNTIVKKLQLNERKGKYYAEQLEKKEKQNAELKEQIQKLKYLLQKKVKKLNG